MVHRPARVFEDVPVLCGHRGSGRGVVAGQRENTLSSFRTAVAAGLSWVEVDVRATADGALVASHDPYLEGDRAIARVTAAESDERGLMRIEHLFEEREAHWCEKGLVNRWHIHIGPFATHKCERCIAMCRQSFQIAVVRLVGPFVRK